MSQRLLFLDFETRSELPLKFVGAAEYARHPSTEILCVAWRIGTRETIQAATTRSWNVKLRPTSGLHGELAKVLRDPRNRVVAQGAIFEQLITTFVWPRQLGDHLDIPLSRWACTASMAAAHALPRDLERACKALGLSSQKNPTGKKLIRKHSMPQKLTKKKVLDLRALGFEIGSREWNREVWNNDPEGLRQLELYCREDVDATVDLFLALPELTPGEREIWIRNQRVNKRGIHVDRQLVTSALKLIAKETTRLNARTRELSNGVLETANQRNAVLEFLQAHGTKLPDLKKKTVEDAIQAKLVEGTSLELLKIRQAISKTSTAKYVGFELRTRTDSRLRDFSFYHGSSTGRETGQGVQINNLTKPTIDDVPFATKVIRTGDHAWSVALLENVMESLASCTRGALIASPGYELFCADYNAIEVRVLFWLADHVHGLTMFRNGEDLYVDQATEIYDLTAAEIDDLMRDLGKRVILGGGFGMGPPKFKTTCAQFGSEISLALAKKAIKAYREKHKPVTLLWSNLERAAIAAARSPGMSYKANKTRWFVEGKFLYCELPSGRRLAYFGPKVRMRKTPWGDQRPELMHWGVDPKTKQWVFSGTYGGRLTENVVQATARDLMVVGQANTDRAGYTPLHSIYDELLSEREKGTGSLKEFEGLMVSPMPRWAHGLPLKAKGWVGHRYRKG